MKQVLVKGGQIVVESIPAPVVEAGTVLVRVGHSCISAGTELSSIAASAEPLYKRAMRRPELVKKAVKMVAEGGLRRTMDVAKGKMAAGNATGYSAAGVVFEVGADIDDIKPGMRVACAGAGIANHAEYISVPRNLLVPVPDTVDPGDASTVTLGAIALQGVRRAQPTLGETFVVIGLGILGQITTQLLKANGCRVIAIDLDDARLDLAKTLGADRVVSPRESMPVSRVLQFTEDYGADGVIVTAAGPSHEILSTAFQMCRKKGRVVLVGDVGLNIKRADIYQKEIDFFISTSYGPGRYDDRYELHGLDYPIGYVRWTENRNMAEYLRLLGEGVLNVKPLISNIYPVDEAPQAYESFKQTAPRPLIVLLSYDADRPARVTKVGTAVAKKEGAVNLAVIGAGGFAQGVHIPNIKKLPELFAIRTVVSRTGANAVAAAAQCGATTASTDYREALGDPEIDAVVIATRHNLHAEMALEALQAGKHVLVEKPLAINRGELERLISGYEAIPEDSRPVLTVGFNRRFSRYAEAVRRELAERSGPVIAVYRMNAGYIPGDHWVHGEEGGGRNIGEACHIYDLFNFLTGAEVESVTARSITPGGRYFSKDNFTATIRYTDGSVCTLTYTAMGDAGYPKEHLEVYADGKVMALTDYKKLDFFGTRTKAVSSGSVEKGQFEEVRALGEAIRQGTLPIPLWQLVQATEISFAVEERISR